MLSVTCAEASLPTYTYTQTFCNQCGIQEESSVQEKVFHRYISEACAEVAENVRVRFTVT